MKGDIFVALSVLACAIGLSAVAYKRPELLDWCIGGGCTVFLALIVYLTFTGDDL